MGYAMEDFGRVVRRLRRERGLTQEKLAELSNLHPVFLSAVERGKSSPTLDSILKLCDALEVPPGQMMNFAFVRPADDPSIRSQILALIENQRDRDLRRILALIQAYLETP